MSSVFVLFLISSYETVVAVYAVAQFAEALCYKPEVDGFDSRSCHQIF
jgi:hypothetical protein